METKVVGDPILAILRYLGQGAHALLHALRHAALSLPVVVFLASVTLVLVQYQTFRAFDDNMLAGVMSMRGPTDTEKHNTLFSAAIISRELFTAELGRKLPFDKDKLAGPLRLLAAQKPWVIAVDVDAISRGTDRAKGIDPTKGIDSQGMFEAIKFPLERGIAVVLVSYPTSSLEEAVNAYAWRKEFCVAAKALKPQWPSQSIGKLWWASTYLQTEGRTLSVLRYHSPAQAEKLAKVDESLLPLGHVLAAASASASGKQSYLETQADYCKKVDSLAAPTTKESGKSRREINPLNFINYFEDIPASFSIDLDKKIPLGLPLENGTVVLGVQSFEGVDEHPTPLGRLPGALLHAFVASSLLKPPLSETHLGPFLTDIAVGYVFVLLFHGLQNFRDWLSGLWPLAGSLRRLLSIVMPISAGMIMAICVARLAPSSAALGLWLNPLPMLIGLTAHLYLELIPGGKQAHSIRGAFRRWKRMALITVSSWNWRYWPYRMKPDVRVNVIVWTCVQQLMLVFVVWALYILTHHAES